MATRLDLAIDLDEPPEAVFDLMADVGNEPLWNPDALDVKRVDDGPLAPGAEWEGRYKGMGTMRVRLDEYERPRRITFTTTGDRMDMRWAFDYSPAGESSTHVDAHAEIQPKGAMRLMGPLIGPMIRRTFSKRPAQLEAGLHAAPAA
jgi:Polyketide cyclase / dehydrase and lipid transport